MKHLYVTALILLYIAKAHSQSSLPVLSGPYLGQTPPGDTPEIFAPGYVSTEHRDFSGFFSPDMSEFYFTRKNNETEKWSLLMFEQIDNEWQEKLIGPRVWRPTISPDGDIMHLGRFYMQRVGEGWSEVKSISPLIDREEWGIMRLTSSRNGTYVFDDYKGGDVLRISRLENGKRLPPEKMSSQINSGLYTAHPFIAPDESYLIWDSERPEGKGESDLYISFKQSDGTWGAAINLGDEINTPAAELGAYVSPDNQFLFFNRMTESGNGDIYWVDASFIKKLNPSTDKN